MHAKKTTPSHNTHLAILGSGNCLGDLVTDAVVQLLDLQDASPQHTAAHAATHSGVSAVPECCVSSVIRDTNTRHAQQHTWHSLWQAHGYAAGLRVEATLNLVHISGSWQSTVAAAAVLLLAGLGHSSRPHLTDVVCMPLFRCKQHHCNILRACEPSYMLLSHVQMQYQVPSSEYSRACPAAPAGGGPQESA